MTFNASLSTTILILYMIVVLGVGLAAWRVTPSRDMEDYLLADRSLHWFVGFFSFSATFTSALIFMGFIAFYYNFGLSTFIVTAGANILIVGGGIYFLAPKVWKLGRKFGHITPADTVRDFYDSPILGYITATGLIIGAIPYLQLQFTGVGLLLELATGGLVSLVLGSAIIAIVIGIYTWLGGMKSVAWVDTMQGIMIIAGTFLGGLILLYTVGEGFAPAYGTIQSDLPRLLDVPGRVGVFTWPYIMTFGLSLMLGGLAFPQVWMRFHYFKSGRATQHLPWVWSSVVWLTQFGGWAAVLAGVLVIPDAPPDQFILLMYRQFFPTVVFALIASAGLAAMMSTASSVAHSIGAIVSQDITEQVNPDWKERTHVLVARLAMSVAILTAFLLSTAGIPFLVTSGVAAGAISASVFIPQAVAAIYGIRWLTKEGAIVGASIGGITALALLAIFQIESSYGLYAGFFGILANVVLFVVVSLVTSTTPSEDTVREWEAAITQPTHTLEREHRDRRDAVTSADD